MGLKVLDEKGQVPSIPFLQRAIELDPNFPMAYASLATIECNLQELSPAQEKYRQGVPTARSGQ
jgi:Tfp pilus assembly protein PilF